ncbi:hypothetical protein [Ammoniphilus sp. 3BR4]|uniref:rhamnogalacturonan lyase family protein n=1 Tax=Ammoniphilus sp. 3BR4 TaxID=3158265 RepID=UPI003466A336
MARKRLRQLPLAMSLMVTFSMFSGISAIEPGQTAAEETAQTEQQTPTEPLSLAVSASKEWKFDFGSADSPVAAGYTRVDNTMIYDSARGYGLDKVTTFRDRGTPDEIRRDFVNGNYSFLVDVPNGDYYVKIIAGDTIAANTTNVSIEGASQGSVSSSSGNFSELTKVITVTDGQLNFAFSKDGRVNAIEIVPVSAPTGLSLQEMTLTPKPSVSFSWEGVEGAESYNVYRIGEGESDPIKIGSSTTPNYTDETAELGSTYHYTVTQVKAAGVESPKSISLSVTVADPSVAVPAAPSNLTLKSASENSITLTWEPVDDDVKYYIYKAVSEGGPYTRVGIAENAEFTDDTVSTTQAYYYKVVALNLGGFSQESDVLKTPISKVLLRQMEKLNRGLVAVKAEDVIYVGWRMLGTDPESVSFNLYREGEKINVTPITGSTNYLDKEGTPGSTYEVRTVLNGREQPDSSTAKVWNKNHLDIPLQKPEGGITPDGVSYTYNANDASVGDLDGDGEYEIIVKWDPSNSKDNSRAGYTGNVFIDAYKLDGTRLWRIDLGKNIRAGAHYTQMMVYDLDGNGKAEVAMKTADGTVDGLGTVIGDANADHRNSSGYILSGPEYLTIFDGLSGKALTTTDYEPPRGNVSSWGDGYGNRVDRFLAGIAYLDGEKPSLIMARGYYTRSVLTAYNWRDGKLDKVWTFDSNDPSNSGYAGQGNHNLSVADVDGDGKDEITYGAMAVDDDGTGLYTTGLGHGDAMHLSDLDPDRPGMEVFQVHEDKNAKYGIEFRDADTGETIWGVHTGQDTGRGLAADIEPNYKGAEVWAIDGAWNSPTGGLFTAKGEKISTNIPPANFAIWWDGDLQRELLDHDFTDPNGVGKIDKWDYVNQKTVNLLTAEGTFSNNSTKGNPALQADILGDWREEAIWRTEDSSSLRIFTTTDVTDHRIHTLMHDPVYRQGIAWQNVGYNQPPHTSFYLGHGMTNPPAPNIYTSKVVAASVDVNPNTLNLKAEGGKNSMTAFIELPQEGGTSQVSKASVIRQRKELFRWILST